MPFGVEEGGLLFLLNALKMLCLHQKLRQMLAGLLTAPRTVREGPLAATRRAAAVRQRRPRASSQGAENGSRTAWLAWAFRLLQPFPVLRPPSLSLLFARRQPCRSPKPLCTFAHTRACAWLRNALSVNQLSILPSFLPLFIRSFLPLENTIALAITIRCLLLF